MFDFTATLLFFTRIGSCLSVNNHRSFFSDIIRAYKCLRSEKEALEASLQALSQTNRLDSSKTSDLESSSAERVDEQINMGASKSNDGKQFTAGLEAVLIDVVFAALRAQSSFCNF